MDKKWKTYIKHPLVWQKAMFPKKLLVPWALLVRPICSWWYDSWLVGLDAFVSKMIGTRTNNLSSPWAQEQENHKKLKAHMLLYITKGSESYLSSPCVSKNEIT